MTTGVVAKDRMETDGPDCTTLRIIVGCKTGLGACGMRAMQANLPEEAPFR